jgi:hypothetical protein
MPKIFRLPDTLLRVNLHQKGDFSCPKMALDSLPLWPSTERRPLAPRAR